MVAVVRRPLPTFRALFELLSSMFTPDELQRFIALQPDGDLLLADLASGTSAASLIFGAVGAFERHGWIDEALFDALAEARPRRRMEIAQIGALVLQGERVGLAATALSPRPTPSKTRSAPALRPGTAGSTGRPRRSR